MEAARVRPSRRLRLGRVLVVAALCSIVGGMATYAFVGWPTAWRPATLPSVFASRTTGVEPPPPAADARDPTEAPSAAPPPAPFTPTIVKLSRPSALYVRPNPLSNRATRLPTGQIVRTYPAFAAPEGWTLGQSEKGTIGFISTRHLAGQPDPTIDRPRRPRRRAPRRRRTKP